MESNECSQHFASYHFQLYGCKGPVDRESCGSSVHRYTHREQILNYLTGLTDCPNYDYTHRIHVWYNHLSTFTIEINWMYIGKYYTSPMDPMGYTMMQSSQYFAWTNSGYLWESFTETTVLVLEYIETSPRNLEYPTWLTYKPKRPPKSMCGSQVGSTFCANWGSHATWASMSWTPNSSPPNESIFGLLPGGKKTYKH